MIADLRLGQLEPSDRERVLAVVDDWWGRPMPGLLPRPFFTHFRDTSFVIKQGEELVAFLLGFLSQTYPDEAYVHAVAVAPAFRDQGVGRLLYRHFIDVVIRRGTRRVHAITSAANVGSLAFHRRLGFSVQLSDEDGGDAPAELVLELPPIARYSGPTGRDG